MMCCSGRSILATINALGQLAQVVVHVWTPLLVHIPVFRGNNPDPGAAARGCSPSATTPARLLDELLRCWKFLQSHLVFPAPRSVRLRPWGRLSREHGTEFQRAVSTGTQSLQITLRQRFQQVKRCCSWWEKGGNLALVVSFLTVARLLDLVSLPVNKPMSSFSTNFASFARFKLRKLSLTTMSRTSSRKHPQRRINFKCVAMRLRVLRQNLLRGNQPGEVC